MKNLFKTFVATILVGIAVMSIPATAQEMGASGIGGQDVRRIGRVQMGTVLEVRRMVIHTPASWQAKATGGTVGAALGAALGGKVGSKKSNNYTARALMGVLGGVAGAVAGDAIGSGSREGIEMIILLKNGELVTITQEVAGTQVPAIDGDVYIATVNGITRVYPATKSQQPARAGVGM